VSINIVNLSEAAEMQLNPGMWIDLGEKETPEAAWSFAHQITIGRRAAFRPRGTFEGKVDGNLVSARYIGDGAEDSLDIDAWRRRALRAEAQLRRAGL
jgi:hypothetical protein